MQKVWKCSCDYEYAIRLFNRCQDNSNRNQEQGWLSCDLQCVSESENAWFWLGWLVWMPRKRLEQVSCPETTSNLDFDLSFFCDFFTFCSASLHSFQHLFSCFFLPYVMLSALGQQNWSKSCLINACIFDLISIYKLAKFDPNHILFCIMTLTRILLQC